MKQFLLTGLVFATACGLAQGLIDTKATKETVALYNNLKKISQQGFIFGHQDDDAYGVTWVAEDGRSDVKEACGAYPGVHGWDLGKIGRPYNLDSVSFDNMHQWIAQVYQRGGINTISWHSDNPVSKKAAWDKTPAVKEILPGGSMHTYFLGQLDLVAAFLDACEVGGTKIPIIFRPYHEHNGDWFWWGKGNCTEDEYKQLWIFTVDYLKNKKNLHHLIYAISPDRSRIDMSNLRESWSYAFPGDQYVDVLGLDNYADVGAEWNKKSPEEKRADFIVSLKMVSALAMEKNKVAAMTETGNNAVTDPAWFTKIILNPIKENPDIRIAYLLVWRNFSVKHHYVPYAGHPALADFKKFHDDESTLFESDLRNIYKQ